MRRFNLFPPIFLLLPACCAIGNKVHFCFFFLLQAVGRYTFASSFVPLFSSMASLSLRHFFFRYFFSKWGNHLVRPRVGGTSSHNRATFLRHFLCYFFCKCDNHLVWPYWRGAVSGPNLFSRWARRGGEHCATKAIEHFLHLLREAWVRISCGNLRCHQKTIPLSYKASMSSSFQPAHVFK